MIAAMTEDFPAQGTQALYDSTIRYGKWRQLRNEKKVHYNTTVGIWLGPGISMGAIAFLVMFFLSSSPSASTQCYRITEASTRELPRNITAAPWQEHRVTKQAAPPATTATTEAAFSRGTSPRWKQYEIRMAHAVYQFLNGSFFFHQSLLISVSSIYGGIYFL